MNASPWPVATEFAAWRIASRLDAQYREIVTPLTVSGSFSDSSTMMRPMLKACSPCGIPHPHITSSTSAGSSSEFRSRRWSTT
jgi:hypothetical protein